MARRKKSSVSSSTSLSTTLTLGLATLTLCLVATVSFVVNGLKNSTQSQAAFQGSGITIDSSVTTCPDTIAAVCGIDGETYANDCYASKASTPVECAGECPCPEL